MNYSRQQKDPTKQSIGFLVVVLLHVGLGYLFVTGLGHSAIEVLKQPLETKLIEEVKPPDVPPPPPPPKIAPPPPPFIPMPEFQVRTPSPNAITQVTHEKPPEAPPPAPPAKHDPVIVPAVIDAAKNCPAPEFPAVSKRMEETGTVVLNFLIGTDGKVVETRIESSSGHPRLDEAAKNGMGRCQFKAGTIDGKPEQTWARVKYTFKLD